MSILNIRLRPWVLFDVKNPKHREWFFEFVKTRSWRHCPVRFVAGDEDCNLIGWIQREMVLYYADKEFTKKTPAAKKSKTVKPLRLTTPAKVHIM